MSPPAARRPAQQAAKGATAARRSSPDRRTGRSSAAELDGGRPLERALAAWLRGGEGELAIEARSEPPDGPELVVVPVLAVPTAEAAPGAMPAGAAPAVVALHPDRTLDLRTIARRQLRGAAGETLVVTPADPSDPVLVLVGLGPSASLGRDALRRAGAATAGQLGAAREVVADLRGLGAHEDQAAGEGSSASGHEHGLQAGGRRAGVAELVQAFVEGLVLAAYRYEGYRPAPAAIDGGSGAASGGDPMVTERVVVVCDESGAAERGVERAAVTAAAVRLARDLVNTPAGDCTPSGMADVARRIAENEGLGIEVIDAEGAASLGLGGLLGVARGSSEPPVLVRLTYEPDVDAPPDGRAFVALVGKGITFDSGGLSLKDPGPMMTMKTDMSGAAAVLATLASCRRLGVDKRVVGFMPLTENMPGGRATKPGDVLRMRNGTTVEVLNTDAEGRLVLADALSLAVELAPDAIVDLATLTGACIAALGKTVAGLMGSDAPLLRAVESAGERSGEAVWHLPLPASYRSQLDSEVADLKNIGAPGEGGALVAGLFLEHFTAGLPWAHLDIAGPARAESDNGHLRKGATGFGVRILIELLGAPIGRRDQNGAAAAGDAPVREASRTTRSRTTRSRTSGAGLRGER